MTTAFDGESYQRRFDELAASGAALHGEADLVLSLAPVSVLDAGCGTGRVAIELARRGVDVVGVDVSPSMLSEARRRAPELTWVEGDMARADLGRLFDVVVMAGNVPLFTPPGNRPGLFAGCARHLAPGGCLVTGFSLDRDYALQEADADAGAAQLDLFQRWSTWEGEEWRDGADYAVSRYVARGKSRDGE